VILNSEGVRIHVAYYTGNFDTGTDKAVVATVMLGRKIREARGACKR